MVSLTARTVASICTHPMMHGMRKLLSAFIAKGRFGTHITGRRSQMDFKTAVRFCHVSAHIYRAGNPSKKYNKNHNIPLEERVPKSEQQHGDWCECDPEEDYGHY